MPDSHDGVRWEPGTQILQRDIMFGRLVTSRPVTVVADGPELLVLYTHQAAPYRSTVLKNRYSMTLTERYDRIMDFDSWSLEERVSGDYRVLTFNPPDAWHSIWLFWTPEWEVMKWYVNFQTPIRRTSRGIIVEDLTLDITVEPDMSWSWKDEDEFAEGISRGHITESQEASVRSEADRLIRAIEDRESPFGDGWEDWRANPDWPVPSIPADWAELEPPGSS